jgi:SAM-dependent methyltransferase
MRYLRPMNARKSIEAEAEPFPRADSIEPRPPKSQEAAKLSARSGRAVVQSTRAAPDRNGMRPRWQFEQCARVLHVGSGAKSSNRLHAMFRQDSWVEIRCDIDEAHQPDLVVSICDMRSAVEDGSCDAIWASHVLEHLPRHDVHRALGEFARVLVPGGFALIRCPDLETVAQLIIDGRVDDTIYVSHAGPITVLDMLYGHGASIKQGDEAMRHGTAFTENLLAKDILKAGFREVRTFRKDTYEVWAIAFKEEAVIDEILSTLAKSGSDFRA